VYSPLNLAKKIDRKTCLCHSISGRHLSGVSFMTSLKPNLCTALTTQKTTKKKSIMSHKQNMTPLQPSLFVTGIHGLLVTSNRMSSFPSADHCQGQLKTPQSLPVISIPYSTYKWPERNQIIRTTLFT
jgi:hypothetical protein